MIHNLKTTPMKKCCRFLLFSLLTLVASDALACFDESYAPAGYYMYRVYENKQDIEIQRPFR